jgi:hypothetical protein
MSSLSLKNPRKTKYIIFMLVMVAFIITTIVLMSMHKTGSMGPARAAALGILVPAICMLFGTAWYVMPPRNQIY